MNAIRRYLPILDWLPRYQRADLRPDLLAGLTTAVMLVPQGMAYAMLAGLPPQYGLYASTIPLIIYALFGSSRQLAVGPVAMVSLLVLTGVSALAEPGSPEYIGYALTLAVLVGALQFFMGVFRMGFLVNFLSHPVISGFTSAAAIIIGLSQLKNLLGIDLVRGEPVYAIIARAVRNLGTAHLPTVAIGLGSVGILLALKKWAPKFPRALAVVVLSTVAVMVFGLGGQGVSLVGSVPEGLPSFSLPGFDNLGALVPIALTIALVSFMESVAVARAIAAKRGYEVNADQELLGLGAANLVGSLFGAYPTTGGFSRTAVNDQAGARTQLAAIITAVVVAIVLLFLTPLFHNLPKAALAGIIMVAVFGLVDVAEVKHLWHVKRSDLALLLLTFAVTLIVGAVPGIITGVAASMLWFTATRTRPFVAELGRQPGRRVYRNVERGGMQTWEDVMILRFDASFYFGNVAFLRDTVKSRLAKRPATHVVLDASGVNAIDASGVTALERLVADLRNDGVHLSIARVKLPVDEVLRRSGVAKLFGEAGYFDSVHEAVVSALGSDPVTADRPVAAPSGPAETTASTERSAAADATARAL